MRLFKYNIFLWIDEIASDLAISTFMSVELRFVDI
jgi:hypothetical protein